VADLGGENKMNAVIYTRDNNEFEALKEMVVKACGPDSVSRAELSGHKIYRVVYDIVIVTLDGAEGMEVALEYTMRFPGTRVIWISNDPYFAAMALRNHIYDFVTRPFDESWLEHSIREAVRQIRIEKQGA